MIQSLESIIEDKQNIAIFGHTNIDGDCLGSMLSLGGILESLGKDVDYRADDFPSSRNRVPGIEKLSSDLDTDKEYDLWIGTDFSPWQRTGQLYRDHQTYFDQLKENILIIDHHIEDNFHATRNLKDADADANCVRLYELIKINNREHLITPEIATLLLMGILTDTGRFTFDAQPARVLRASSELISLGADKPFLIHQLYRNTNPRIIPIFQQSLDHIRIEDNICMTYRDETTHGSMSKQERDMIINFIQGLSGYKLFIFATIRDDRSIKLSLRSKQDHEVSGPVVDCNSLASQHFTGGGHIHAAGCIHQHQTSSTQALEDIFQISSEFIKKETT